MEFFDLSGTVFLGLALGSFATALSYRLPRGISIVTVERSQCPVCQKDLGMADLVPLFSWIFLRGKCRHCRAPIGWRYPVIELATLAVCLLFYSVYGLRPETLLIFTLAPVAVSIIDIDLRYKIIPDSLNLAILLTGVAALCVDAALNGSPLIFFMEKGVAALGGALLYGLGALLLRQGVMRTMKREPMGLGDVKFFAAAGFWMGISAYAAALFMIVSGVSGIILSSIWKKRTGEAEFPFGPSLILAFIAVLWFFPPAFVGM
ncbi:MAG: prepilin peptidase [Pseudomonadota bacterium]